MVHFCPQSEFLYLNRLLSFLQMDNALHVAIREHTTESALVLLDYGAPVDAENAKRATPLIIAAQKGNTTLVRELLERGANIAAATLTGLTAMLQAAHFGKTDVLKLLLQSCNTHLIECANYNQTTALMRASQEGHVSSVQLLLEAGAQVCVCGSDTAATTCCALTCLLYLGQSTKPL